MENNLIAQNLNEFKLYLEGLEVTFSSFTLREIEGAFPSASISLPATTFSSKVLPGTMVQFFGKDLIDTSKTILLFEGEVTSLSYQKAEGGRLLSLSCSSLLSRWSEVTASPKDAFITPAMREAQVRYKYRNLTERTRTPGQSSNELFDAYVTGAEKRQEEEISGELNNFLIDNDLIQTGDILPELIKLANESTFSVHEYAQFFLRKFELFDIYYGIIAQSYRLANSMVGIPNFGKVKPYKYKQAFESIYRLARNLNPAQGSPLRLISAIQEFLSLTQYTLVNPAGYTSTNSYWNTLDERSPIRGYFMPKLENSPPAKCNIFFPHQVSSVSFSRQMMGEPTRTIGSTFIPTDATPRRLIEGAVPFVLEPSLNITQRGVEHNSIGFNPEETYRGVRVNQADFSWFFTEFIKNEKGVEISGKKTYSDTEIDDLLRGDVRTPLNQITANEHHNRRLNNRSVGVSATWSPYRIVGVPGVVIDEGDGPSVVGTVSAITSVFNGSGSVSSTVNFRAARFVYDLDELAASAEDEDFKHLINDFSLDPFIDINSYLYDEDIYGYEKIGSSLYPLIIEGVLSSEVWNKKASSGKEYSAYSSNINRLVSENVDKDYSIIDILRDEENNIITTYPINFLNPENTSIDDSDMQYTHIIFEAVHAYKNLYKRVHNSNKPQFLHDAFNKINFRRVITEGEYKSYLNIGASVPFSNELNYKDAVKLFTGTDTIIDIKDNLTKNQPKQGSAETERQLRIKLSELYKKSNELTSKIRAIRSNDEALTTVISQASVGDKPKLSTNMALQEYEAKTSKEWKQLLDELVESAREVNKQILSINEELGDLVDQELETSRNILDNQLYRPYNLTRKVHVKFAFKKQIKQSLRAANHIGHELDINK